MRKRQMAKIDLTLRRTNQQIENVLTYFSKASDNEMEHPVDDWMLSNGSNDDEGDDEVTEHAAAGTEVASSEAGKVSESASGERSASEEDSSEVAGDEFEDISSESDIDEASLPSVSKINDPVTLWRPGRQDTATKKARGRRRKTRISKTK